MRNKNLLLACICIITCVLTACNSYLNTDSSDPKFNNVPNSGINTHNKDNSDLSSYTLLIYMCGSDLESEQGYATKDLEEMCKAKFDDELNVIVETGGTRHWDSEAIDRRKLSRYRIINGYAQLIASYEPQDMGDEATLTDFLMWGIQEYPAEHTGVILWNHGSGAAYGVCFDELFDNDSLLLSELRSSFKEVCGQSGIKFDFVGFDACMMATIETAGVLSDYADYMIASQEVESGCGWNYQELLGDLSSGSMNDSSLGKRICDYYIQSCDQSNEQDDATMSFIDLNKFDEFSRDFNIVTKNIAKYYSVDDRIKKIIRKINSTKNYGGNNNFEGYTNMIDAGCMLKNLEGFVDGADDAYSSYMDMVIYCRNGKDNTDATGMSVYYPVKCQGADELRNIRDVALSPYYIGLINYVAFRSQEQEHSDYDKYDWASSDANYWMESDFYSNIGVRSSDTDRIEFLKDDGIVKLSTEPQMTENGSFTAIIDQDSMDYVQGVYSSIFSYYDDNQLLYLGKDSNVSVDRTTGEIKDNFWGGWAMLPDGQPLTMEVAEEGDNYNIYTVPILIDGRRTNMRVKWIWNNDEDGYYTILGAWDGIQDNGSSARNTIPIEKGSRIQPVYTLYNTDSGITSEIYGEEYRASRNFSIKDDYLPENNYYYSFEINDIYGGSVFTDTATFYVDENGEVWYYDN